MAESLNQGIFDNFLYCFDMFDLFMNPNHYPIETIVVRYGGELSLVERNCSLISRSVVQFRPLAPYNTIYYGLDCIPFFIYIGSSVYYSNCVFQNRRPPPRVGVPRLYLPQYMYGLSERKIFWFQGSQFLDRRVASYQFFP